ncbi:FISUMP domain-containing protein [Pseudoalteromonas marina]|uniref:FISUMP domain-containing protein n=1 Tax=Pseudoalteromonas marina TaxID=267375 RepID=UPI002736F703|nr:FISUMP domain-containing protein [Pseudoalteromonas marina]MDP2487290.1 FISUMP domain-containing protein [Pseudoalteromonas marina]
MYGRLYDWHNVTDTRKCCPEVWRVASDEDYKTSEIGIDKTEVNKFGWREQDDVVITLKGKQPDPCFSVLTSCK